MLPNHAGIAINSSDQSKAPSNVRGAIFLMDVPYPFRIKIGFLSAGLIANSPQL
jgi:hypothetical protein